MTAAANPADPAPRTLVIQPLPGVGDMVWHLHFIETLAARSPRGKVSVLTKRKSAADSLFTGIDFVEDVLWVERNPGPHDGLAGLSRLAGEIRQKQFASAWILHDSVRYGALAWRAGIADRRGYGIGLQRLFLSDNCCLGPGSSTLHPIEKARRFFQRQGLELVRDEPLYPVAPALRDRFLQANAHCPRPWFGFGVASAGTIKCWPSERFARLAEELTGRTGGTVFVIAATWEQQLVDNVTRLVSRNPDRCVGTLCAQLDELAAFVSTLDAHLGNDSGVLNLAASVQVPCLGIYGASHPLTHSRYMHSIAPVDGIIVNDESRMQRISVDEVLEKLDRLGWLRPA